jgi:tetratricopeptide (TPR) repeat protein
LKDTHDYEKLSKLLILMADLKKKTSGFSKKYLSALKDLAEGFKKSSNHPSVLYLLGEYYQKKKDYNRSYSAYHDLKQKYPNSPEANLALGNIKKLKKKKPLLVDYFPSKKIISEAEDLDISPERKIFKKKVHDNYYAISIGPFPSSQAALQIKRMIKNLGRVRMVQLKRGYLLYVGQLNLLENALQLKIRIGEEYGVNGRIVKIIDDQLKEYVYGE